MDLKKNAPKGEFLAYINKKEAAMLKKAGGSGELVNGIPSFEPRSSREADQKSSTNQGPAGGASAGGNYGGNVNPNQTYAGKTPSQTPSNYGGTGPTYYGGNNNVGPKSPPPKPKPTKDNTIKKNIFESYFNYSPVPNILDKITKSKFNTNINAKRREDYLNDLLETDPDEYNRVMGDLAKVNMIVGPQGITSQVPPSMGFTQTDYGMPSAPPSMLTSNFEEIDGRKSLGDPAALEILGQKYKDTLTFPDNGGGDGPRPLIPINYNTGAATIEDVEPYNQFTYDENAFGPGGDSADVTRASYDFNKGGRAGKAEGGIMGTRARRAMGGIMNRVDQRQAYGLGSIVKSITKPFKSVAKAAGKVLKSDLGKAALLAAGAYYMPGYGIKATGGFGNMFAGAGSKLGPGFFSKAASGISGLTGGMFSKLPKDASFLDKALKFGKFGLLGYGLTKIPGLNTPKPNETSYADRGGHLIDPLTGQESIDGGPSMRKNIELAKIEAAGDPDKLAAIDLAYNNMLNLPSSRNRIPYEDYKNAADGGRIGYGLGKLVGNSVSASMSPGDAPLSGGASGMGGMIVDLIRKNPNMFKRSKNATPINQNNDGMYSKMFNNSKLFNQLSNNNDFIDENMNGIDDREEVAMGGRIGKAEGGLMDLGGMEKDYRAEGGFVPIGEYEKKDDVPARLSVNEFVFTADAVRGAGQGDIDKGAEIMENMMENLENGGTISEESQGKNGAQQMFETSQRLGEVV